MITIVVSLILIVFLGILIVRHRGKNTVDHAFGKYIESYTSGTISRAGVIRIRLAGDVQVTHTQNQELGNVLDFSPDIKGKAYWVDSRTIEFKPDEKLKADKAYDAVFNLGDIINVPDHFSHFRFSFQTLKPDYSVSFRGLQSETNTSLDKMKLVGTVQTADVEDQASIEKIVSVNYPSATHISWQHNNALRSHQFTVTGITRTPGKATPLTVNWDGQPVNVERTGKQQFDIPAVGDFKVLDVKAIQDQDEYVLVQFSDPILVGQELTGLITLDKVPEPAYTIEGSTVKVYAPQRLNGNFGVVVHEGIKNIVHKRISQTYSSNVFFENRMPAVTIPGKGVILPDSGKLAMSFEAINLKAVDVSIVKIYADNVPQYFQSNGLDGGSDLRMVGKPVLQKTIRLDDDKGLDLSKKNRFMLDLDQMIRTEPGAIYRVIIGFRREYSLFNCKTNAVVLKGDDENNDYQNYYNPERNTDKFSDEDDEFWQRYDSFTPSGFSWQDRNDPCTDSYYTRSRWATRNIIASNIGLIAKRGNDNTMVIAVTNLLTAKPMSGIDLEFLDFQKQSILKTKSDGDGFARVDMKRKPYLLIARNGSERGYLKLDDGASLPLSRFNVGGEQIQSGLKGFLYGERGVWRPGDSIYMSFILQDKAKTLPADHPVEFELYNPQGQLYRHITQTRSLDGFYTFRTATEPSSPTGNWTANVKVGGAIFTKTIKVETVMPNRLKVNLSFGGATELTKGGNVSGSLNARWLFGGTAQNLKAKVDAFLSPQTTKFKGFEDYTFDDPTLAFNTQTETIFDDRLDANGNATVNTDINVQKQAPGQLKANFVVKVFEPGGNFSINQVTLPYNVYRGYVGIKTPKGSDISGMLYTDRDNQIDIADVDAQGHAMPGTRNLELQLYKIQWRWWWDEGDDETISNFTQDQYNRLIKTENISVTNGHGKWNLRVNQDGWGRYLLKIKDPLTGHSTGKIIYLDWPNWSERLQQSNPTEAAMLSFTSDKTAYKVGETATLTIPTAADGRALISLENGSKVLSTTWIDTKKGQTRYSFKIDETMAPNVFVNVTMLQRHAQTVNDLPIRMYGAIPLQVDDPQTILKPTISMPDKIKPESTASITVGETNGKEMTYTVAIVDEGLLDLTNFKTPDPHSTFYAREALGVKTWDLYDYVIGAFGGGLDRILSIGGDGTAGGKDKNVTANRFKPVVKFLGPFHLDAGEKKTTSFTMPQYVGSVKAMVIAGHDGAYGFADKTVAVKKPLMILATLPRVLGPGEKIQLPVTVFAMEPNVKSVNVQVQSNAFDNLGGNNSQTITFDKPGDQLITFNLDVKNFVGIGKVKIIARSGNETAVTDVELNVRNPNPPITSIMQQDLAPGQSWQTTYQQLGMTGTSKASLEVSTIPPLNLGKRLDYLIEYPYGCVEQTTSSAFPQLYLDQITALSPRQKAETERNIRAAINRLTNFQTVSGGMSYWPDGGEPDAWGTNYSGHFMLAAQAKGYSLPAGFLDGWKRYQKRQALSWSPDPHHFYYDDDLDQAYRLYLLALAGAPEMGAMNRLREYKYLDVPAKWRLAEAYKLAGQPETALRLISGLTTEIKPYNELWGTYGSDLRDEAMILETLTTLGQQKKALEVLQTVAARLSEDNWYSTQSTAYSLLAIAKYCGTNRNNNKLLFTYNSQNVSNINYLWQSALSPSGGNVSIKNTGNNHLFVRLIQKGQPVTGENQETHIEENVLQMHVAYFTLKGQPIDPTTLKQGTDFMAQVNIKNPGLRGEYKNMALTQIFPSGWEIINTRMLDNEGAMQSSPSDYMDVRDDRVYTYFGLPEGKDVTYYVMLNAAYAGKYYMPATYCEAMYNSAINALVKGKWVEVTK